MIISMDVTLSWDLFVIVFFAIVITYSFIIGKHESIKIIISTYIATVAAQGLGNLMERFSGESESLMLLLGINIEISMLATTKLILFVATIVFLAVRGGFEIEYTKEGGKVIDGFLTAMFGFITAGLLISTLITFIADKPLLDRTITQVPSIAAISAQSQLTRYIVEYQDVWFALPAIVLLITGFLSSDEDED